jgi:hypothetical protein
MSVFGYCPNIRLDVVRDTIEVSFGIVGLPLRFEPGLSILGRVMLQEQGAQAPYLYHGIYSYQSPRANLWLVTGADASNKRRGTNVEHPAAERSRERLTILAARGTREP